MGADLYRELMLDHWRSPRHAAPLSSSTHTAAVENDQCGDAATAELEINGVTIRDLSVRVSGCALATAAGSLLAERTIGRSISDVRSFNEQTMIELLDGAEPSASRRRCATLALEAVQSALSGPVAGKRSSTN